MTSKLKCPFCGKKLVQDRERSVLSIIYRCPDDKCFLKYGCAESGIWQALIQAKQDFEKANAELDYIKEQVEKSNALYNARNTLEQIEHKV